MSDNNSVVSGTKAKKNKMIAVFCIAIGLLFIIFVGYKVLPKREKEELKKDDEIKVTVLSKDFNFNDTDESSNSDKKKSDLDKEKNNTDTRDFNNKEDKGFIGIPTKSFYEKKLSRSGRGGVITFAKENSSNSLTNGNGKISYIAEPEPQDMFSKDSDNFKPTKVFKSSYDPNLLLEQGTYIPCVLRQKLISNVGGQISCTVSSNVLSKSGNVVLLEKGTKINGLYKSAGVKRGSNQIFVIWQEARTSNNLVVSLNSGATDELGANGISGWVDQHFWERFGNAIVVSMISDISSAVTSQLAKNNSTNYLQNTQDDSANIAQTILSKMGDIEPTLYKNQGDKVGVFVARDIDFSSVYSLRLKQE